MPQVQGVPPVSAYPRPSYPPPHNYIALAVIVTVICCLLNLTSLAIGIPAIVMGVMVTGLCVCVLYKQNLVPSHTILPLSVHVHSAISSVSKLRYMNSRFVYLSSKSVCHWPLKLPKYSIYNSYLYSLTCKET